MSKVFVLVLTAAFTVDHSERSAADQQSIRRQRTRRNDCGATAPCTKSNSGKLIPLSGMRRDSASYSRKYSTRLESHIEPRGAERIATVFERNQEP